MIISFFITNIYKTFLSDTKLANKFPLLVCIKKNLVFMLKYKEEKIS